MVKKSSMREQYIISIVSIIYCICRWVESVRQKQTLSRTGEVNVKCSNGKKVSVSTESREVSLN